MKIGYIQVFVLLRPVIEKQEGYYQWLRFTSFSVSINLHN